MKEVLVRYYDKLNLGDDLFIKIVANRYHNQFNISTRNRPILLLDNIKNHSLGLLTLRVAGKLLNKSNLNFALAESLNDIFLHIGGSLFIDQDNCDVWQRQVSFYSAFSKPYYVLGSNVGPYKTQEFLDTIKPIFEGAQDVCFRDRASYELYKDLPNVRVASDIVFTLDPKPYLERAGQEKKVVFSIIDAYRKFDDETAARYDQQIIDLTKNFIDRDYEVVYMSFCKFEGDKNAIKRLYRLLPEGIKGSVRNHFYQGNIDDALDEMASSEVIVGTRFHASILGLLFGKKVLPVAYSDKTTNILKDMNFQGPIVDIRNIKDFDGSKFDPDALQTNDISEQIELAEKQFQELDKVLTRRDEQKV